MQFSIFGVFTRTQSLLRDRVKTLPCCCRICVCLWFRLCGGEVCDEAYTGLFAVSVGVVADGGG